MNFKRLSVTLLLGIAILTCASCGKENAAPTEGSEDTSATTSETTTKETIIEDQEYEEPEMELTRIELGTLLGFDNCYAEGGAMYDGYYDWTFYTADGQFLGSQFGFYLSAPEYYLWDWDDDGNEELICPVQYGGDGTLRVNVYRNNNGTIEEGDLDERTISNRIGESLCALNYNVTFDTESGLIIFSFYDRLNDKSFPLRMDDYIFREAGSEIFWEQDFEGWKSETVVLSDEPLLGFDNWYCERTYDGYGYSYWDFYTEDGSLFAKEFGEACEEKPIIYIQDLDGDGKDELICDCYYHDCGETHLFIYKNDNGVIKGGYLPMDHVGDLIGVGSDITQWDYYEDYDKTNKRIVVYSFATESFYEPTIDDFTFVDGDPTINFGS